jgi:hypothetical protein
VYQQIPLFSSKVPPFLIRNAGNDDSGWWKISSRKMWVYFILFVCNGLNKHPTQISFFDLYLFNTRFWFFLHINLSHGFFPGLK